MDEDLAAFVRSRYPALVRRAYLLTGSREAAEDLVQDALARTCAAARRRSPDDLAAYVDRCLVNLAISGWRRRQVAVRSTQPPRPDGDRNGLDGELADQVADQLAVAGLLRELAPRQRAAVVLRYYEDLSETQVAALLGISVGTVRSTTQRALQRLRALLTPGEPAASGRSGDERPA